MLLKYNILNKGEKIHMKKSLYKKLILFLSICFIVIWQFFWYSPSSVDLDDYEAIQNKYNLHLEDENWRCNYYTKNTIINFNPPYYRFVNFFVELFKDEEEPFNTKVTVEVTEGDTIFNTAHSDMVGTNYLDRIVFTQSITHNNLSIDIEMLNDTVPVDVPNSYSTECKMKFKYNDYLYHVSFWNYSRVTYTFDETEIHEDELQIYLDYLDEILDYEQ